MSIVNRRNAVLGYTVWVFTKAWAKQKAKAAVPRTVQGTHRPNRSATILSALAAFGGALWIWRHHGDETEMLAS